MPVRFVIGRAGSGKTRRCIEAVRARLARDPLDGPRLILLVPEQAALQMERGLLAAPNGDAAATGQTPVISASHRAEVLSFRRLAFRVLETTGRQVGTALTEPARAMVLRHLAAEHACDLKYYGRLARPGRGKGRLSGFVESLGSTIAELIEEAVEPDALIDVCGEPDAPAIDGVDATPKAKLHDIALLYESYIEYLGTERMDPSQYLQVARSVMGDCTWLRGAELWVDGFASFSGQERLTLIQLVQLCTKAEMTVLLDPQSVGIGGGAGPRTGVSEPDPRNGRLFSRIQRTYTDLIRGFEEAGLTIEDPIMLDAEPLPRFVRSQTLLGVERHLFSTGQSGGGGASFGADAGQGNATVADAEDAHARRPESVELVELPTRRHEVDYAISRICDWVQSPSAAYRYNDIAIIVRDLDPYHDLLSAALTARGIPFFIDRRRPVAHHPLVELLRGALALAAESLSLDAVRLVLKAGLLPIENDDFDELENYLIAHGVSGASAWRGGDWTHAHRSSFTQENSEPPAEETAKRLRVNETRRAFLAAFDTWLSVASQPAEPTGAMWASALVDLIEHLEIGATLGRWSTQAEQDGDLDQAEEHRQVWRDVMGLLDDLAFVLGDTRLTVRELDEVLEAGLSGLTLGLVPPTIDQVMVGSVERTRHPSLKAAIVIGVNHGVFPKRIAEDAILNDDDRTFLQESGVRIGPPVRERVHDEASLFYIAMTRASEAVVVTYASSDSDGRALRPSPYVAALQAASPGLTPHVLGDPARTRATWDVLSPRDLSARVTMELRTRPAIDADDLAVRGRWNELYATACRLLEDDRVWRRALSALDVRNEAALQPQSVERLFGGALRTSVSQLETYAACPFQYFARYALDLREREEAKLEPVDIGQVHHAILEEFVRSIARRQIDLGGLSEGDLIGELQGSCERVAAGLPSDASVSDARNAYVLRRSASQLARVLRAQRDVSAAGRARPRAAELPFGFGTHASLPPLELMTPSGRHVQLRGYIDRVDWAELGDELLGVVVDYKRTRNKRLDLSQVYHGLSLQLIAYLLVLAEHGTTLAGRRIRPIGGVFVSLQSQYRQVDDPEEPVGSEHARRDAHRPRGIIRFDDVEALDAAMHAPGRSRHYTVQRKMDGALGSVDRSDGAAGADFDAVLDHTRRTLGALADRILDGDFSVEPYRLGGFSPCSWCAMSSVCRFEMGISTPRFLDSLKRSDVFARLTGRDRACSDADR